MDVLRVLAAETDLNAENIVLVCYSIKTHAALLYERLAPERAHRLKERFE